MQLIYIYANVRSRNINTEINFDSPFEMSFQSESGNLLINRKKDFNRIENFYGKNICNFDVLVGKNGFGKSTILELIGLKREDLRFGKNDEWILLFCDNQFEELSFVIECHRYTENGIRTISFEGKNFNLPFSKDFFIRITPSSNAFLDEHGVKDLFESTIIYSLKPETFIMEDFFQTNGFKEDSSIFKYEACQRQYLRCDYLTVFEFMNSRIFDFLGFKNASKKLYVTLPSTVIEDEKMNILHYLTPYPSIYSEYYEYGGVYNSEFNEYQNFIIRLMISFINYLLKCYDYSYGDTKKIHLRIKELVQSMLISEFSQYYYFFKKIIIFFKKNISSDEIDIKSFNCFFTLLECVKTLSEDGKLEFVDYNSFFVSTSILKEKNQKNKRNVEKLLKTLWKVGVKHIYTFGIDLSCHFDGLSSGESSIISILSSVNSIPNNQKKSIVLLDEPDCYLHPEWSRRFVYILCKYIKNRNNKFDIIMSTHSPLTISDFFSDSIHFLDVQNDSSVKTFCGNIGDILVNQFFIERPFGEYAFYKVNEYLKNLKINKELNDKDIKEFLYLIDNIGDIVMRKSLEHYFNKWLTNPQNPIVKKQLIERKKEQIKKLEEEIKNLEEDV